MCATGTRLARCVAATVGCEACPRLSFSPLFAGAAQGWHTDIEQELKLDDVRVFDAGYGWLPRLSGTDPSHDIVFPWNGTTSGVCVPHGDWIAADRSGLTLCDATSAAFAMDMPWDKLDVTTFSWQKVGDGHPARCCAPRR